MTIRYYLVLCLVLLKFDTSGQIASDPNVQLIAQALAQLDSTELPTAARVEPDCKGILVDIHNIFVDLTTRVISGYCVLLKEDVFLNNPRRYVEIARFTIKKNKARSVLILVNLDLGTRTQYETRFKLKKNEWKVARKKKKLLPLWRKRPFRFMPSKP